MNCLVTSAADVAIASAVVALVFSALAVDLVAAERSSDTAALVAAEPAINHRRNFKSQPIR